MNQWHSWPFLINCETWIMTLRSSDLQSVSDLDSIRNSCDVFYCPNVVSFHLTPEISHDFLAHRLRSTQQPTFEGQIKKNLERRQVHSKPNCANTVHHRRGGYRYNGLQALYEDEGWEKGKLWTFRIKQQPAQPCGVYLSSYIALLSRGAFFAWRVPILSWPRIMCSQVHMLKFWEPSREMP